MEQLTIDSAIELRDRGMQRALDHAEDIIPNWQGKALGFLLMYRRVNPAPFMAEEFREWAYKEGLPKAPSGRAFGSVFVTARKKGFIKAVGFSVLLATPRQPLCG